MSLVQKTHDIGDAASLSIVVDQYVAGGEFDIDEVLESIKNIIRRCADDHHQSRAMATVAIKLIDGVTL